MALRRAITNMSAAWALFTIVAWSPPAQAAEGEPRVGVVPVSSDDSVSTVALSRIRSSLLEGLQQGAVQVVGPDEVVLADPNAGECTEASCLAELARKLDVSHMLSVGIESEQRDYTVTLLLVDKAGATTSASKKCIICGFDEVATMVHDETLALAEKIREQPMAARLTVKVQPAGALVTIDGTPLGRAPISHEVPAGPHKVLVKLDGYTTLERDVVAVASTEEVMELELEKIPVSKPRALRIAGWTLLGTGAVTLGAGAAALALHHRPVERLCTSDADYNEDGLCRWRYNTVGPGAALLALGAATAITGAVLTSLGYRRARLERTALTFGPGSVLLSIRY